MGINKIVYSGNTLIDLTSDTVTADKLCAGYTAHAADGSLITGTMAMIPMEAYITELNQGYVASGTWKYENPTRTYVDIYEVIAGHRYFITLGGNVGSRFRCMFTTTDVSTVTSDVAGTNIINTNNPAAYANASYTTSEDGYIVVAKDNVGKTGIKSYVYDAIHWI